VIPKFQRLAEVSSEYIYIYIYIYIYVCVCVCEIILMITDHILEASKQRTEAYYRVCGRFRVLVNSNVPTEKEREGTMIAT